MSKTESKKNELIAVVKDKELIDFFYLGLSLEALHKKIRTLSFTLFPESREVPFNAQLRGYISAMDNHNTQWIAKPIDDNEVIQNCLYQIVYYLDFALETLSAPVCIARVDKKHYRITKVLPKAVQISSYNYLEEPFRLILANDLINRWLTFDEDRNPNNYMILYNSGKEPLVIAIDFNKADLESGEMKITGLDDRFGWHRLEKTRFLTLLKPSNFEGYTIKNFRKRLQLLGALDTEAIKKLCRDLLDEFAPQASDMAEKITVNIAVRARYIHEYFSRWFGEKGKNGSATKSDYSGFGQSFVDIFKKKI